MLSFTLRAFLMRAPALLSSGLRYLNSAPSKRMIFGGSGSPNSTRHTWVSRRISNDVTNAAVTQRANISIRPAEPGISSSVKSPDVAALCPTIMNCRIAASGPVSYTHLRAHETRHDLVCRLLLEKKKKIYQSYIIIHIN